MLRTRTCPKRFWSQVLYSRQRESSQMMSIWKVNFRTAIVLTWRKLNRKCFWCRPETRLYFHRPRCPLWSNPKSRWVSTFKVLRMWPRSDLSVKFQMTATRDSKTIDRGNRSILNWFQLSISLRGTQRTWPLRWAPNLKRKPNEDYRESCYSRRPLRWLRTEITIISRVLLKGHLKIHLTIAHSADSKWPRVVMSTLACRKWHRRSNQAGTRTTTLRRLIKTRWTAKFHWTLCGSTDRRSTRDRSVAPTTRQVNKV